MKLTGNSEAVILLFVNNLLILPNSEWDNGTRK